MIRHGSGASLAVDGERGRPFRVLSSPAGADALSRRSVSRPVPVENQKRFVEEPLGRRGAEGKEEGPRRGRAVVGVGS